MADVVLVEDDEDLREDLAFLIEYKGYSVVTAANGRDALDKLRDSEPPCIIIIDLMMPVMDGWTLRAELLKRPELADVPVVLMSGVADLPGEARGLMATDYLTKPVDLDKLYNLVCAHC